MNRLPLILLLLVLANLATYLLIGDFKHFGVSISRLLGLYLIVGWKVCFFLAIIILAYVFVRRSKSEKR